MIGYVKVRDIKGHRALQVLSPLKGIKTYYSKKGVGEEKGSSEITIISLSIL